MDTGSCVSICSEKFYNEHLSKQILKPLNELVKIECADGNALPYNGYIEVLINTPGIENSKEQLCLLLVVPNTEYNQNTPVLLGTNILSHLLKIVNYNVEINV